MVEITTAKQAVSLTRSLGKKKMRSTERLFVIEGVNFVAEAMKCGIKVRYLLCTDKLLERDRGKELVAMAERSGISLFRVDERTCDSLTETETPQGIIAVCEQRRWDEHELLRRPQGLYLALDSLQDPGNLGTIVRTADAVGASALLLGQGTVDLYNSKALRSTMGSLFRLPVLREIDLVQLVPRFKLHGVWVVAADSRSAQVYYRADLYQTPLLVIIGNEGHGIAPELLELADQRVQIPLKPGVDSLNASVAAALILYECHRQGENKLLLT